ncbi:MAG: response regulator [Flavobacteriales bacterium]
MEIKILIADDHEIIIDGLKTILQGDEEISVIGSANSGSELLKLINEAPEVDLVLVDINMPDIDGIEATQLIKELYPEIKVLILSMYERVEFVKKLMAAGADGYLLKNSNRLTLTTAIKTLQAGGTYYSEEIKSLIMSSLKSEKDTKNFSHIELSDREKDVIRLIALEKNTQEIADELFLSKHTVDSHRKRILNKINVKNIAGLYKYALQSGIIKGFDIK